MELWRDVLGQWVGKDRILDQKFQLEYGDREWKVGDDAEINAAHSFHIQLISRVGTQPLGYSEGSEDAALASIHTLFESARKLTQSSPNIVIFETIVWYVLNTHIRPFTSKWHPRSLDGSLRALDSSDVFRSDLSKVMDNLIQLDMILSKIIGSVKYIAAHTEPLTAQAIESEMLGPSDRPLQAVWRPMGEPSSDSVIRRRSKEDRDALIAFSEDEQVSVSRRRKFYNLPDTKWASGIALSGGGIRSASFAVGVLVSLSKRNLLPQFDYLSTVSGGGYAGAFLTQLLGNPKTSDDLTLKSSDLPFKRMEGESLILQRLRHGASFLSGGAWERFSLAMFQVQGIFINLFIILLAVFLLALAHSYIIDLMDGYISAFFSILSLTVFSLWAIALQIGRKRFPFCQSALNRANPWVCATLLVVPLVGLSQIFNLAFSSLRGWIGLTDKAFLNDGMVLLLLLSILMSSAGAALARAKGSRHIIASVATFSFVLIVETFFLQIISDLESPWIIGLIILATYMTLMFGFDINTTSLHHYYKTKISAAFLLDATSEPGQPIKISEFDSRRSPFPIINCALNVPGSNMPELRGRQSDIFSFTPICTGANLIGYSSTTKWEAANDSSLDLAAAVALSGAAVSPQIGQKTKVYGSFWMTLLNIRLSLWLKNPASSQSYRLHPNLVNLKEEILSSASEEGAFLNISDGGHIENLGIYELLKRRCRFIIAVDGESDGDMTFHGLTNLQRLAYIDHGITIEADLADLRKDVNGLSRSHFRLCRIRYPRGEMEAVEELGYLIYLKLSLTGNEGEFIRRFKSDEPAFPHHSTANQFFSEVQFEAYRALGEHVGDKLFLPAITNQPDIGDVDLEAWFVALGKSLLEPEAQYCR